MAGVRVVRVVGVVAPLVGEEAALLAKVHIHEQKKQAKDHKHS